jgi:hypothetical protein
MKILEQQAAIERLKPGIHRTVSIDADDIVTITMADGSTLTQAEVETEIAANGGFVELRMERDGKLSASDWTQASDVTLANKAAWATYRQALRDLPANTADPANPTWPTKPGD